MQITTKVTCVSFLLAISSLTASVAQASSELHNDKLSIESRLSRLTEAIQEREADISTEKDDNLIARGFANRSGRGGFVNGYRGGFGNRYGGGGSFVNRSPFRNGGGFYNRYGGGGFVNRGGWRNGGFLNRW